MAYNMWFLAPTAEPVSAAELIEYVEAVGEGCRAELSGGVEPDWTQLHLTDPDGGHIAVVERYTVDPPDPKGIGPSEIEFLRERLEDAEPAVNARWVTDYLPRVKTIYLFGCSSGFSERPVEFDLVQGLLDTLRDDPGGILYAEFEGWSNEDGQHLTWEFSDDVAGTFWMTLRRPDGWAWFEMDLANPDHRRAFRAGEVPTGVVLHTGPD